MQLLRGQLPHLPQGKVSQGRCPRNEVQRLARIQSLIQLLWFNLECPDRFKEYRDPLKLRSIFSNVKKGKGVDRPAYVRL